MKEFNENYSIQLSKKVRKKILKLALAAGSSSSHFGGSLSTVEIISTLYGYFINFDKQNPLNANRDRFILSKGHGCLAFYAMLSEKGLISDDELQTFEKNNSRLLGHPVINREIGIEFSNGSLGMGISLGIGVAIALKKKNLKNQVYVIIGDGECNEGSVWEAAMSAPNFKLDNLCVIIDSNKFQQTGTNSHIMKNDNLIEKWKSFNWNVNEIDGHNLKEIYESLKHNYNNNSPKLILANTIKGKGFKFSENNNDWHHAVLTQNMFNEAIQEIDNND